MRSFKNLFVIISLCFTLLLCPNESIGQLDNWEELIRNNEYQHTQLALSVYDIDNREELYGYNSKLSLVPASSLKVLTTFIAWELLGETFRYETKVYVSGEISEDGTLYGDIIITGSGDPSLASPIEEGVLRLTELVDDIIKNIKRAGVNCIEGTVVIEEELFESLGVNDSWAWDDLTNYYASGAYSLNIHENYFSVSFSRSNVPFSPTSIASIYPEVPYMNFANLVTTGAERSGDNAYLYGDPYRYDRTIKGTIPPGKGTFTIKGAIPRPGEFFKHYVLSQLSENDVKCSNLSVISNSNVNASKRIELVSYYSPFLKDLIRRANFESNNLYCEALLKTIAAKKLQRGNISFEDGVLVVNEYINSNGGNISSLSMYDGSGLSIKNKVSTELMASFLASMFSEEENQNNLLELLPRAGKEGSVRNLLKGNIETQGKIWLKSGSMGSVQSYSGIIKAKSGKWIAICIIANGHQFSNSIVRRDFESIIENIYTLY